MVAGLFAGQTGALGLIAGSVFGLSLTVSTGGMAVIGTVFVYLVLRIRAPGTRDADTRTMLEIGFFMAAAASLVVASMTNFAQPRFEELLFGHIFSVSNTDITVLLIAVVVVGTISAAVVPSVASPETAPGTPPYTESDTAPDAAGDASAGTNTKTHARSVLSIIAAVRFVFRPSESRSQR